MPIFVKICKEWLKIRIIFFPISSCTPEEDEVCQPALHEMDKRGTRDLPTVHNSYWGTYFLTVEDQGC